MSGSLGDRVMQRTQAEAPASVQHPRTAVTNVLHCTSEPQRAPAWVDHRVILARDCTRQESRECTGRVLFGIVIPWFAMGEERTVRPAGQQHKAGRRSTGAGAKPGGTGVNSQHWALHCLADWTPTPAQQSPRLRDPP